MHLTRALHPERTLLAGLEATVWEEFPARTRNIETITPKSFHEVKEGVGASVAADVTGGMESKSGGWAKYVLCDTIQRKPGRNAIAKNMKIFDNCAVPHHYVNFGPCFQLQSSSKSLPRIETSGHRNHATKEKIWQPNPRSLRQRRKLG